MNKSSKAKRPDSKVYDVPVRLMRVAPANNGQREFRKAWGDELAANLDLNSVGRPVVNHRDGLFWIIDGQHRIYALKERFGEDIAVECQVFEGLSDSEAAGMFLSLNDSKHVIAFTKFMNACAAVRPAESEVLRVVEANGLKVSREKEDGNVAAVTTLLKVFRRSGSVVLGQTLRAIRDAFGNDAFSFDRILIDGVGLIYHRYNGKSDEKTLTMCLSRFKLGARGVLMRAEALRARTGNEKAYCVAAVIIEAYNKAVPMKQRLAPWWKDSD